MIPYNLETMRLLNPSTVAVRHFADLEYRASDREWVLAEAQGVRRSAQRGGLKAALVAYLSAR